jgi:prepilin-type processing-associated H-X9-DG protein
MTNTRANKSSGFTKRELLMVMAIATLLVLLTLPALRRGRSVVQRTQCFANMKQLTLAWTSYAAANTDRLVANHAVQETRARRMNWVNNVMSWGLDADNTNLVHLQDGKLAPYLAQATRVYRCPADRYLSPKQRQAGWTARNRSVAMNAFLGNPTVVARNNREHEDYVHALKFSDIAKPSEIFVFLDQHADGLDDANFFVHPELPPVLQHWHDVPASYHDGSGSLSFADGHVETRPWRVGARNSRMTYADVADALDFETPAERADAEWLAARTAFKK